MKQAISIIFSMAFCFHACGQGEESWFAWWSQDSTLIGFKDAYGKVKIIPRFTGFTIANKFDQIIAVTEEKNNSFVSYHLTKEGKTIGRDSLWISDNGPDCESEGHIRFRVRKTDRVGLFNGNGDVVIPAEYNALSSVANGMVIGLKGAKKKYWDKGKHSDCNHYSWSGGKEILLSVKNQILVDNFSGSDNLNLYSLIVSTKQQSDSNRRHYKGIDGNFYSFVDNDLEFQQWFENNFFNNISQDSLSASLFEKIVYWQDSTGWLSIPKQEFIDSYFKSLKHRFLEIKESKYNISNDRLNKFIFDSDLYSRFYDNCGDSNVRLYPVKTIVTMNGFKDRLSQDRFTFLRTEDSYKLISIVVTGY